MVTKLFVSSLFPVILIAGDIDVSFKNHSGDASYTVRSDDAQVLRSQLVFPFDFHTLDISYRHHFRYFDIKIAASSVFDKNIKKGKDYDWQKNTLTVYSESKNTIDNAYDIGVELRKNISNTFDVFTKFQYKILDTAWIDTYQEDYVKNTNEYKQGRTLTFEQEFYSYHLGIRYTHTLSENLFLHFAPSAVYSYINTKDTHILRDFYTIQNVRAFGYEINCQLKYTLQKKSDIKLSLTHIDIEDSSTNMYYYNRFDTHYLTYPSSYKYQNTILGIHYKYSF